MNLPPNLDKHITLIIDSNGKALMRFLELLKQEKHLLTKRDYTSYQKLLAEKQLETQNLAKLDDELCQLLKAAGLPFTKASIEELLDSLQPSVRRQLYPKWKKVVTLSKHCSQLNKVNERILFHSKQAHDRLINLVRGGAGQSKTYSATGQTSLYSDSERRLAEA